MASPSLVRRLLLSAGRNGALVTTAPLAGCLARRPDDGAACTPSGRPFCASSEKASSQQELKQALLTKALDYVATRGWSAAALNAAARDLNLSPAVVGLLPRAEAELVEHYMEQSNERALRDIAASHDSQLPLDVRMANALQMRLQYIVPFIDTWPQALAIAARPSNVAHSATLLFDLIDGVWHAVGDDSADASWYTKRAVIAGVYGTTSLYMLTDYSPGFRDTWQALRRRVADGLALEGVLQTAANVAAHAAGTGAGAGAGVGAQPASGKAGAHQQAAAAEEEAAASQEGGQVAARQEGGQAAAAGGPAPSAPL